MVAGVERPEGTAPTFSEETHRENLGACASAFPGFLEDAVAEISMGNS